MLDALPISTFALRFATSGMLGAAVVLVLLAGLRLVLPTHERARLRSPAILLGVYVATLAVRLALGPDNSLTHTLSAFAPFFILTALAQCGLLLVVDVLLERRLGRTVPRILQDIAQAVLFVGVVLITLRAAGVEPGSLLTTSALITAVIGLSLQDTLGNLFAGLSIQAQRPFEVGDWIQIEPDPRFIGQVIEINWRATKILTSEQIELIIPNGVLAKSSIRNYTKPTSLARRTIEVQAPYDVSPRRVEDALLMACQSAPGVLAEPPAYVLLPRFADSGITYQLCYFVGEFARRDRIDTLVRQRIWASFQRAAITFPYPTQTLHLGESAGDQQNKHAAAERARRLRSFQAVDFLAALDPPLQERLATLTRTSSYMPSELILRQGDAGHTLFIVQSGEVSILLGRSGGSTAEVARLGAGKFFGEMSLMTGERRSATVQAATECELVEVDKAAFHEIITAAPHIAERVTEVLIARQSALEENASVRASRVRGEAESKSTALLAKIKQFFAI
jgi:small-conductance mechanosensitive channel